MVVGVQEDCSSADEMSCFRGGYNSESDRKGAFVCLVVIARIGQLDLD